ncbi:MAG: hypothetical protein M3P01_14175 [Actinomycetota bacterium]|nr:hypothetical protein [Actinomycetota bacterium]
MTPYQLFLLVILILWPFGTIGLLFLMARLERYVARTTAETPAEAGLEPVAGRSTEREVRIVFGDKVIGESEQHHGAAS